MRGRGRGFGEKRGGGGAAWANWAQGGGARGGWVGRGRPTAREREKKRREKEREKERKDLLLIFEIRSPYMNAFALSKQSKEMQGSAWCIKQPKVFRVFHYTGIPNRIPLELWKRLRFSEGKKKKRKGNARIWRVKKRKNSTAKFGALQIRRRSPSSTSRRMTSLPTRARATDAKIGRRRRRDASRRSSTTTTTMSPLLPKRTTTTTRNERRLIRTFLSITLVFRRVQMHICFPSLLANL